MGHVMLDLETLGTSKRAVIMQIGLVRFEVDGPTLPAAFPGDLSSAGKQRGEGWEAQVINVSPESCQRLGMEFDGTTIQWWLGQSAKARRGLFTPVPVDIRDALIEVKQFIDWSEDRVWGMGPSFDCAILSEAFRLAGDRWGGWNFVNERDVRTVLDWAGISREERDAMTPDGEVAHNALADAWQQARAVQEAYRRFIPQPPLPGLQVKPS